MVEPPCEPCGSRTEEIWEHFSAKLRGFLRSRLPDNAAVDDALQDIFIKVHTNIHRLRDGERIQSWLFQIARNAIADYYRRRPEVQFEDLVAAGEVPCAESEENAEQRLAPSLLTMIEELPPRYRDAIRLTEIDGLTQAEMASRLEVSLSGGKSRVQRGREKLKEMLLDCCHIDFDRHGTVIDFREWECCEVRHDRTK